MNSNSLFQFMEQLLTIDVEDKYPMENNRTSFHAVHNTNKIIRNQENYDLFKKYIQTHKYFTNQKDINYINNYHLVIGNNSYLAIPFYEEHIGTILPISLIDSIELHLDEYILIMKDFNIRKYNETNLKYHQMINTKFTKVKIFLMIETQENTKKIELDYNSTFYLKNTQREIIRTNIDELLLALNEHRIQLNNKQSIIKESKYFVL